MSKRTDEETAALAARAQRIGYRQPPAHLIPTKAPELTPKAWDDLWDYFDDHTSDANDAILVFFAMRVGCSIGEAYVHTDGYFKRRNATDEDGTYWSYN